MNTSSIKLPPILPPVKKSSHKHSLPITTMTPNIPILVPLAKKIDSSVRKEYVPPSPSSRSTERPTTNRKGRPTTSKKVRKSGGRKMRTSRTRKSRKNKK